MNDGAIHFCPLVSGSSGNATFVASGKTHILIDCGRSGRHLARCLEAIDQDLDSLTAILLTHEHSDHIAGIGVLARSLGIPIYASVGTWHAIMKKGRYDCIDRKCIKVFQSSDVLLPLEIGDLQVSFFPIPHDARDPVGYRITNGEVSVAVATDTGTVTPCLRQGLFGASLVLLEANHDMDMLVHGPYPALLKQRILSDVGHLSNENAGHLSVELTRSGTRRIYLGHLSHENNSPTLAWRTVEQVMKAESLNPRSDVEVFLTHRDEPSRLSHVDRSGCL